MVVSDPCMGAFCIHLLAVFPIFNVPNEAVGITLFGGKALNQNHWKDAGLASTLAPLYRAAHTPTYPEVQPTLFESVYAVGLRLASTDPPTP